MSRRRRRLRGASIAGLRTALLLSVAAGAAAITGQPWLFPSLGPSAYAIATGERRAAGPATRSSLARTAEQARVRSDDLLGGHAVGVAAGLAAYWLLAPGLTVAAMPPPLSTAGLRLAASGVLAVATTTVGMLALDWRHAPACATTLIVGLGLLSTPTEGALILAAVASLLATRALLERTRLREA